MGHRGAQIRYICVDMPSSSSSFLRSLRSILAVCVLVTGYVGASAAEFTLPDTIVIALGERREIPLIGTIEAGGAAMIRLRYSSNVIRVISARGTDSTSIYCKTLTLSDSVVSRTEAYAKLSCEYSGPALDDTVCYITIEGVGTPDRTGSISVVSVFADGMDYPVTRSSGGSVVRVGRDIGSQQSGLEITGNYPNPFFLQTRIAFVLPKDEEARFTMRTIQGRAIRTWTVSGRAGENTTDLSMLASEAATGIYVLELVTDSGVAYHGMRVLP